MTGWRARIGHIDASPAVEEEWRRAVPAGVSLVGAREGDELEAAALELAEARPDVVVYWATVGAVGRASELCDRIEGTAGAPAVTTLGSIVAALRELGAQRVLIASDHTAEGNDTLATFLEELGFGVVGWQGIHEVEDEGAHAFYRLGRALASSTPGADTLLVSSDGSPTLELIDALQWDTGLEVVSSSQAALWNALRTARVGEPLRGAGRLLERPRVAGPQ
jgi:maleate isomerase